MVMPLGSTCPVSSPMQPSGIPMLTQFGIGKIPPQNLAPNWPVIYGMTAFMLVCVIFLVIAVIIWRPKNFGRYPVRALRPKYKALGAPIPVTPIPGVEDGAADGQL